MPCNHRINITAPCRCRQPRKIRDEHLQLVRRNEAVRKPGMDGIRSDDIPAGQPEIGAEFAGAFGSSQVAPTSGK